jgi:cell division protein FtsB
MLLVLAILLSLALFCSIMYSRSLEKELKKQQEENKYLRAHIETMEQPEKQFSDEL